MEFIILSMLLGLIPAAIAKSKGRSFIGWWIYGAALFIVAIIHAVLIKPDNKKIESRNVSDKSLKKCPYCAEYIKYEAIKCKHCGSDLENDVNLDSSDMDDKWLPSVYFKREAGSFALDKLAVEELVKKIKSERAAVTELISHGASVELSKEQLKHKYQVKIDRLIAGLPIEIRPLFIEHYDSLL
ncbi:zinc ribbon domain-containing protein [Atlantibacter hermannii]|uniref:zinc ribbon domain-containing protein n=1 Tax=Atlantibacter hermannii TaxID=565 RepID=UPI002896A73B|nr:zinc ribbon domain-containing protein [Atlantibacter hermannii]